MRSTKVLAVLLIVIAITSFLLPIALALPSLESVTAPAGTFVIPMDEKQAERIVVFGFVHALLAPPNPITIFRVIEPPNVTLSTNMTSSSTLFQGGPFLVDPNDAAKVLQLKRDPNFKRVTVATLTTQTTLNNVFRVTAPTKILVIKGEFGRTDLTLDAMRIPYNLTTREILAANPNMMLSYTLIVVDCPGWAGNIPSAIRTNIQNQVFAGNEVVFTDIAFKDLNATFPGYVNISGPQPHDRLVNAYVYNPPRKYDPTKYGSSADRLAPEYPSQYYNPSPRANEIKWFTPSAGYVVSSVPANRVNDVRILVDSRGFGTAGNEYAALAFYFQLGDGIVEGLAVHPQEQTRSMVGDNGYYAVFELYGNKFVHGPSARAYTLTATPPSASTAQGSSKSFTITVKSLGAFNLPVTLSLVSGLPPGATYTFNPIAVQPPAGGNANSTLTVTVPLTTPVGSYVMNITGRDTSAPPVVKWTLVTLNVTPALDDFKVSVSPGSLRINVTDSKTAIVTVTSIGMFNQNVTLNATGLPRDTTVTFAPPSVKPPAKASADSVMRINVGPNAPNGTYTLTIVGSNGTCTPVSKCTRTTPFTLIITKPPVGPGPPFLTLLLLLLLGLLGIALGLAAFFFSSARRRRPPPPRPVPVIVGPARPQRMYVVPTAAWRRRGPTGMGILAAPIAAPVTAPMLIRGPMPRRRALWAFVLAMASAILILLNAAALLSPGFFGPPTNWSQIFFWLGGPSGLGQSIAVLIGILAGFTVMAGAIMMLMGRGVIGALIVFPFAVLSLIMGGGFLAGAVLGIIAGILGIVGR